MRAPLLAWLSALLLGAAPALAQDLTLRPYQGGWWTEGAPSGEAGARPITAGDMVRFVIIGDPRWLTSLQGRQDAAISPSGDFAAVTLRRGDTAADREQAALLIFRITGRPGARRVDPLYQVETWSNGTFSPISMLNWSRGGDLSFVAAPGEQAPAVYMLSLGDREIRRVTPPDAATQAIDVSSDGSRIAVFSAEGTHGLSPACRLSGCLVDAANLEEARTGVSMIRRLFSNRLTLYQRGRSEGRVVESPARDHQEIGVCFSGFIGEMSPDGRFALQACQLSQWPAFWSDYTTPYNEKISRALRQGYRGGAARLQLLDLEAGTSRPLTSALTPYPPGVGALPIWIDSRTLIVPSMLLPLDGVPAAERERRASHLHAALVDVGTMRVTVIGAYPPDTKMVLSARWDAARARLDVQTGEVSGGEARDFAFVRAGEAWRPAPLESEQPRAAPPLRVVQGLNQRPTLVATDNGEVLLDPNAWLDEVRLGRVEPVEFESDGRTWRGTLYRPAGPAPAGGYSLVIQTHGENVSGFSLWGQMSQYGAQPLAARNIAVLQLNDILANLQIGASPELWRAVARGYDRAIETVAARLPVDRARVGLVGWSRTGPYVAYALTHSETPYAAAVLMDQAQSSWYNYLGFGAPQGTYMESDFGARPFGTGLEPWLDLSPSFSLDRIRAPILMWQGMTAGIDASWDLYQGLRLLGRPVELWRFPRGEHEMTRPSERLAASALLVDWFDFWLNGARSSDPADAVQNVRWEQLRRQQAGVTATPRAPLLDWSARPVAPDQR